MRVRVPAGGLCWGWDASGGAREVAAAELGLFTSYIILTLITDTAFLLQLEREFHLDL